MTNEFERKLEKIIDDYLEKGTLEEFFEEFNVTPFDVVLLTYEAGLIDDEVLEGFIPSD